MASHHHVEEACLLRRKYNQTEKSQGREIKRKRKVEA